MFPRRLNLSAYDACSSTYPNLLSSLSAISSNFHSKIPFESSHTTNKHHFVYHLVFLSPQNLKLTRFIFRIYLLGHIMVSLAHETPTQSSKSLFSEEFRSQNTATLLQIADQSFFPRRLTSQCWSSQTCLLFQDVWPLLILQNRFPCLPLHFARP